jgi:hypothetical protein
MVGSTDGFQLGLTRELGACDGFLLGRADGLALGRSDGLVLGCTAGFLLGIDEGNGDGALDGESVEIATPPPTRVMPKRAVRRWLTEGFIIASRTLVCNG